MGQYEQFVNKIRFEKRMTLLAMLPDSNFLIRLRSRKISNNLQYSIDLCELLYIINL